MTAKPRPRVIDMEPIRADRAEKAARSEDDTTITASLVARDMAYGSCAAIFGVLVFALTLAIFLLVPDAPLLGASPWLSGSENAIRIAALCLAVAAFAVPIHISIWLPAKVLFAASYLRKKAETIVADVAIALAVLALVFVVIVSASPSIVSQFSGAPAAVSQPRHAVAPAPRKPLVAAPVPRLEPVAVVPPYRSRYLRFFQRRHHYQAPKPKRRRHG